jgi:hypothetical protein
VKLNVLNRVAHLRRHRAAPTRERLSMSRSFCPVILIHRESRPTRPCGTRCARPTRAMLCRGDPPCEAMCLFDAVSRRSVRSAAISPPFPLGEVRPSAVSAGETPSLVDRFIGTIPSSDSSSDSSSARMLIVRLLPVLSCTRRRDSSA